MRSYFEQMPTLGRPLKERELKDRPIAEERAPKDEVPTERKVIRERRAPEGGIFAQDIKTLFKDRGKELRHSFKKTPPLRRRRGGLG